MIDSSGKCSVCGVIIAPGVGMHMCAGAPPSYGGTGPIFIAPGVAGWRCPACGAGNAPWVARCACIPVPAPRVESGVSITLSERRDGVE